MAQKRKWSKWRWIWVGWLAYFLIAETAGLVAKWTTGEDDTTFSEFTWDYLTSHPVGWLFVASLIGWLAWHFLFQKNRD